MKINALRVVFYGLGNGIPVFQGNGMLSSLKVKMSNVEFLCISTLEDKEAVFSHSGI
jgi:hypothetical protein